MTIVQETVAWLTDPASWAGPNGIPVRLEEHIAISLAALLLALVVALPAGLYVGHTRRWAGAAVAIANIGRAVPTLALIGLVLPITQALDPVNGFSLYPTVIAMVVLAIPPVLVNADAGIRGVDADVLLAARGMGLTEGQVLRRVEMPLASPVILGGVRSATVMVVATVTLGAIFGLGGLGRFIVDGIAQNDDGMLFGGVVLVGALAMAAEGALAGLQRRAARVAGPRAPLPGRKKGRRPMRIPRTLVLGASLLVLVSACATGGDSTSAPSAAAAADGGASAADPTIRVGSDGFYEAKLMAEIYAQALEAAGYRVDRTGIGMGARKVSAAALESGQIDLKPEYIGSGLAHYEPGAQTGDPSANQKALQAVLAAKGGGITVLDFSPAADQNAFVVRTETADQLKLARLSDLAAVQDQLKFGVATDCATNPVCGEALKTAYGIDVSGALKLAACDTPMVQALKGKTIDVGELCSTQPDIAVNGWVVLEDDKRTQPADNLAPLVRDDLLGTLADRAGFEGILNAVSAAMDTTTLTDLGKQVSVDNKDIAVVATAWLRAKGLVE